MPFITEYRQQMIDGKAVRRASWPKDYHIKALPVENDDTTEKVGRVLVLFTHGNNGNIAAKQYTPVWPDIVADDWAVIE